MSSRTVKNHLLIAKLNQFYSTTLHKGCNLTSHEEFLIVEVPLSDGTTWPSQQDVLREVSLRRRVDSPFVIKFKDAFQCGNTHFSLFEPCFGPSLMTFLSTRQAPIPGNVLKRWILQLAEAMCAMQDSSVFLLSLPSTGVRLTTADVSSAEVKVWDFSSARELSQPQSVDYWTAYSAPEVAMRTGNYARVSSWTLGILLYEMATGRHLFSAQSPEALLEAYKLQICLEQAEISPTVKALLLDLLETDPASRLGIHSVATHICFCEYDQTVIDIDAGCLGMEEKCSDFSEEDWDSLIAKYETLRPDVAGAILEDRLEQVSWQMARCRSLTQSLSGRALSMVKEQVAKLAVREKAIYDRLVTHTHTGSAENKAGVLVQEAENLLVSAVRSTSVDEGRLMMKEAEALLSIAQRNQGNVEEGMETCRKLRHKWEVMERF